MKTSRKLAQGGDDETRNPVLFRIAHDDIIVQDIRCKSVKHHDSGGLVVQLVRGGKDSTIFFPAGTFKEAEWHDL